MIQQISSRIARTERIFMLEYPLLVIEYPFEIEYNMYFISCRS